jgi:hypothetical protein
VYFVIIKSLGDKSVWKQDSAIHVAIVSVLSLQASVVLDFGVRDAWDRPNPCPLGSYTLLGSWELSVS